MASDAEPGFTMAELLIALVIILLAAVIVFPNLLRSRIAANEGAAVQALRTINEAQAAYAVTFPTAGFASSLSELQRVNLKKCQGGRPDCLVPAVLTNATSPSSPRYGYWFALSPTSRDSHLVVNGYVVGTSAAIFNKTGVRDFCSLEDGAFHFRVPNSQSSALISGSECQAMQVMH